MPIAPRAVFEASAQATRRGDDAVLALVLETEGSTYVRAGAAALFGGGPEPVGWLSGGCLEPQIAARAAEAAAARHLHWLELDTRDDEDLIGGSAPGCRGRLRLALLPLATLPGWHDIVDAWFAGGEALIVEISERGGVRAQLGASSTEWKLPAPPCPWTPASPQWDLPYPAPARVAVFGAGPETPMLLPLLRSLGWKTLLVERRARWRSQAELADAWLSLAPADALAQPEVATAQVALVMHHHFEFDRETLEALAPGAIAFVGLLGPQRRREDLMRLLPAAAVEALSSRLRSPVGMPLGGQGAEAIALSIAAQLQAWRHGA